MYFQGKTRICDQFALLIAMTGMLAACGGQSDNSAAGGASDNSNVRALWARSVVSVQTSSSFYSVAADGSGNAYVAGNLFGPGSFDFGNGVTSTAVSSGNAALLIKYDAAGVAQWAQIVAAGSNPSGLSSVAVDASGNLYAAGYVYGSPGSVDFGNSVTLTKSDTFSNAILVKYDSSGLAQWAQAVVDGANDSIFSSVAVDTTGNVYVAGEVDGTGTYDFGHGITATGVAIADNSLDLPGNAVVAKYDASGVAQWAQTVTAGSPSSGFAAVAVDPAGNVYAAGSITGTGTYDFGNGVTVTGPTTHVHIGEGSNLVLVRYDSSGVAQWVQTVSGDSNGSSFMSVAVDSSGNVYAAGAMGDATYDFGNGVTATGSVKDGSFTGLAGPVYVVLAKCDASGVAQWARTVTPGGSNSYLTSVTVDRKSVV